MANILSELMKPDGFHIVTVLHDDECGYFLRLKPDDCTCSPELRLTQVTDQNIEGVSRKVASDNRRSRRLMRSRRN